MAELNGKPPEKTQEELNAEADVMVLLPYCSHSFLMFLKVQGILEVQRLKRGVVGNKNVGEHIVHSV